MSKTAIVIGSTGVVGSALIARLLNDSRYQNVVSFSRNALAIKDPKLTQHIIDFSQPDLWQDLVKGNDLFCCIGTTLKKAQSKSRQQAIDLTLPLIFANIAKQQSVEQFILVSSTGANKDSKSFYLSLKGKLEQSLEALNFDNLVIVRPSVLIGKRDDFRLAEQISVLLLSAFKWLPFIRKYRPITGEQVANSMIEFANTKTTMNKKTDRENAPVIKELDELFL